MKMKIFHKLILLMFAGLLLYSFIDPNSWNDFWDGLLGRPYQGDGAL
ncbi:hypothetical protein N9R40_00880 [bacterium]|nr:hypothetical protein [bacterium]